MRIALDWFVNPDHVPLYAAGLGGELVEPADPDEPLAMVVDGRADLALGLPVRVFELADHGVPPFYQLVFVARNDLPPERSRVLAETVARAAQGISTTRADPMRAFAAYLEANPTHDDRFHRRAFAADLFTNELAA